LVLFGIIWYTNCLPSRIPGFSSVAVFFFSVGAYFSINKLNLVSEFRKFSTLSFIVYPVLAIIDLLTTKEDVHIDWIHKAGILAGIVMIFNLVSILLEKNKIKNNTFLGAASFFVFALHQPVLLESVRKILFSILLPNNSLLLILTYLLTVVIVIFFSLILYYFLRKYLPEMTRIITGGR